MHHLQVQVSLISSVPLVLADGLALGSVLRLGLRGRRLHAEALRVALQLPELSFQLRVLIVHRFAVSSPLFLDLLGCLAVQLAGVVDKPGGDLEVTKNVWCR